MKFSGSASAGSSIGKPPACSTPFFTSSTRCRKWVWQGLMSDQVLRMPITGLPAQSSSDQPICKARERWPKERRSAGPNQRVLRRLSGVRVRGSGDLVIGVPSADDQRRSSAPSRRRQRPSGLPSRSASGSSASGRSW